jgi:hypothetical protein
MMTRTTDWLPGKREAQIAMSENWQTILTTAKVSAWNIPATEVTALKTLTTTAEAALALTQSTARTVVITAQAKTAFAALTEKMRFFKSHYFVLPPLTDTDLISLGLKPHDTKPIPIPPPADQAEGRRALSRRAHAGIAFASGECRLPRPASQRLWLSRLFWHFATEQRQRGSGNQFQTRIDESTD